MHHSSSFIGLGSFGLPGRLNQDFDFFVFALLDFAMGFSGIPVVTLGRTMRPSSKTAA